MRCHFPEPPTSIRDVSSSVPNPHVISVRGSSALAPLTLRSKSDTLETRTKLTSHSALVLGGLPRLSVPFSLHENK